MQTYFDVFSNKVISSSIQRFELSPVFQQVVNPEDAQPPPYTEGDFTSLIQAPRYSEVSLNFLDINFNAPLAIVYLTS